MISKTNIISQLFKCVCLLLCLQSTAEAEQDKQKYNDFFVGPYLQHVTNESISIMWESKNREVIGIKWGKDKNNLKNIKQPVTLDIAPKGDTFIHHAQLTHLKPATQYFYQIASQNTASNIYQFRTAPTNDSEASFRFAVYSDNQDRPHIHKNLIEQGVMQYVRNQMPEIADLDYSQALAFTLVAGDIVDSGYNYREYKERYFDPIKKLSAYVPFYPAIGNHEHYGEKNGRQYPYYYDYFELPKNGSPGFLEQWYSFSYSNAHFIALDTNWPYISFKQRTWFKRDLIKACNNPHTDFIFAQFHHPYRSELWIEGEVKKMGDIIHLMEEALTRCGKAGAYFFGHAHGYSRGQSKDSDLYWINVGVAGGGIDYWGAYQQKDYPEFQKTFDEFGFVIVEVTAGDKPSFTIKRLTQGDDYNYHPDKSALQDSLQYTQSNQPPRTPQALLALNNEENVVLQASAFIDREGDTHLASEFQVTELSGDYTNTVISEWIRFENWYNGDTTRPGWNPREDFNTQAGEDITQLEVKGLLPKKTYYWRVRYRDSNLQWSRWSEESVFSIE